MTRSAAVPGGEHRRARTDQHRDPAERQSALGVLGLNVPSLLGVGSNAPYFHNGLAQTLEEVFEIHQLPTGGTIADLDAADDLLDFLRALDGRTAPFRSDADRFHEPVDTCRSNYAMTRVAPAAVMEQ